VLPLIFNEAALTSSRRSNYLNGYQKMNMANEEQLTLLKAGAAGWNAGTQPNWGTGH
jgi:hypothetical protein